MKTQEKCSTCKNDKNSVIGFLIVEGYSDMAFLSSFLNAQIVQIGGFSFSRGIEKYLVKLSETATPIILVDPDEAGAMIKSKLVKLLPNAVVPTVVHKMSSKKKNGIAECDKEEILDALSLYIRKGDNNVVTLNTNALLELGLIGPNAKPKRDWLCKKLRLGECNAKTFLKRCNALQLTKEDLERNLAENGNQ